MNQSERIAVLIKLGEFLSQFGNNAEKIQSLNKINSKFYTTFNQLIADAHLFNPWFTEYYVRKAIESISKNLTEKKLNKWLFNYKIEKEPLKRIGIILAGNIPLVGFHDFLSVLISGNIFVGKLSSKDDKIFPFIKMILIKINKAFENRIFFEEEKLQNFNAVIATGSNNSARYFNYYFGKYPNIIRKNRNSIAILNGKESNSELKNLGKDIFTYFGLGCRNISKIYVPQKYDFNDFFNAVEDQNEIYHHNKYANNVDYQRSIFIMNQTPHLDNGFLLLKEDSSISSPIGVLYYSFYNNIKDVLNIIENNKESIQCVVSNKNVISGAIDFGKTQEPELWDYADGIDTIEFLSKL